MFAKIAKKIAVYFRDAGKKLWDDLGCDPKIRSCGITLRVLLR